MNKISDRIEGLILNSLWCIDDIIGKSYFNQILTDFELIAASNISAKDYYSEKLKSQEAYLLNSNLEQIQLNSGGRLSLTSSDIPKNSIAVIKNHGVMLADGGLCSRGVRSITSDLAAAKENPNISGVILHTSSGGGEALSGQILNTEVKATAKVKPVITYAEMIGSAAYLGAMGSNEIILSSELAQAGSIGAVLSISKTMLESMKQDSFDIYPQNSNEKNIEHRALMAGDTKPLEMKLEQMVNIFHKIVKQERGNIQDTALKGKMFFAKDAKKQGLIDNIGNFDYAVKRLQSYIGKR